MKAPWLGSRARALRALRNMKQAACAEAAGIGVHALTNIECTSEGRNGQIVSLAKGLGVDPCALTEECVVLVLRGEDIVSARPWRGPFWPKSRAKARWQRDEDAKLARIVADGGSWSAASEAIGRSEAGCRYRWQLISGAAAQPGKRCPARSNPDGQAR